MIKQPPSEARQRGVIRGAQGVSAYWASRRDEAPVVEPRQAPLDRPLHRLIDDRRRVVIAPDRPAPWPYCGGWLPLFRDDLNAIADHGSPGRIASVLA